MPTIQVEAQMTAGQLLKAVKQLPRPELDSFVEQVIMLRACQRAPRLVQVETELLTKINQGLGTQDQRRFDNLVSKREIEDLTADENAEFLRMTNLLEALNVERMEALAELARIRGTTLLGLMKDLGITTPADA